ncbi:MAG: RluA family pseudouridine synthase [Planctomycetaceae bacterium]
MAIVEAQCVIEKERSERADRIVQELTGRSRSDVRGLFDNGCVTLNGEPCQEAGLIVKEGDVVVVRHDSHRRYHEKPRARGENIYRLVFEDQHLLVVDKAAGVLTVPTERGETITLFDALSKYLRSRNRRGEPSVVHRLDRATSGLLVFGKNPQVAKLLQSQFQVRKAEREYAAIVAGNVAQLEGTFASKLATTKSLQRYSVREGEEGEDAVTHYKVEQKFRNATFVRAWLETGRRNQIRVHFAEAGHPVLGDDRYRSDEAHHPGWNSRRLALHARVLGFEHPRTGKEMHFESPLPIEFERFLANQR